MTLERRITHLEKELSAIKFRLGVLIGVVAGSGLITGAGILERLI